MQEDKSTIPNCMACRYFYITYEAGHPYGCQTMNFKSKDMPCRVVFINSGMQCQAFRPKEKNKR